jgi:hypothetical protein
VQTRALVVAVRRRVGADRTRLDHGAVLALVARVAEALAVLAQAAGGAVIGAVCHEGALGSKPSRVARARLLGARALAAAELQVGARRRVAAPAVLLRLPLGLALAGALHASAVVHAHGLPGASYGLRAVLALETLAAHTASVVAHAVLGAGAGAHGHLVAGGALVAHVADADGGLGSACFVDTASTVFAPLAAAESWQQVADNTIRAEPMHVAPAPC